MEPTPTGESATPSADAGEPGGAEAGDPAAEAPAGPAVEARGEDHGDTAPVPPAPRSATHSLPRRARTSAGAPAARASEPRKPPGRDPDGRSYRAPDEETLNRLLTGLRDI
jgi:hypothetical protein